MSWKLSTEPTKYSPIPIVTNLSPQHYCRNSNFLRSDFVFLFCPFKQNICRLFLGTGRNSANILPKYATESLHNERRIEQDGFGSDLSPSTSTLPVSVFQCRRAAAGFCMLPMSRLQETVPLCLSLFLQSSPTFYIFKQSLQFI